jgi:hypothetical protein
MGQEILRHLAAVEALRQHRRGDGALNSRLMAVKDFQHQRFARTYQDLMAQPVYAPAARFFLDDLYGPADFSLRDAQFARIVPALIRLFPPEMVATVATLAELHALSEDLDDGMARHVSALPLQVISYRQAWRASASPAQRARQIGLMVQVGQALARFTRSPVLRGSLRVMRVPAKLAGLSSLQSFLERGFDTFGRMPDPEHFLRTIAAREQNIADWLFGDEPVAPKGSGFE